MDNSSKRSTSSSVLRRSTWIIFGFTIVINAIALWMILPNIGSVEVLSWGFLGFTIIASLMFILVGTLILNRHPRHIVGWLFLLTGLMSSIQAFLQGYLVRFYLLAMGSDYLGVFNAWILNWIWVPIVFVIILIPLFYPNGRLPSPRWRNFLVIGIFTTLIGIINQAFGSRFLDSSLPQLENPFGITDIDPYFNIIRSVFFLAWLLLFIGSALSLFGRFHNSHGIERQQIKWLFYASILVAISMPVGSGSYLLGQLVFIVAMLFLPIAVGIAILQYHLWDIDLVIRRTLVYATLTLTLGVIYFGSVILLQWIFTRSTGQGSPIAIVISTLTIAALFTPLHQRLQSFINQRFYRGKYDAEQTLSHFSEIARDEVDIERLIGAIKSTVTDALQPEALNLWMIDKDTIHD